MYVNIKNGSHRNHPITGIFPVAKPFKATSNGGHITVKTGMVPPFQVAEARVKVDMSDFEYCSQDGSEIDPNDIAHANPVAAAVAAATQDQTDYESEYVASETEGEAIKRIEKTFAMLNEITDTAAQGIVRGLVVSGPPGIGKSHGVEETLKEANMFRTLAGNTAWFEVISGAATPISLYKKLYDNRFKGFVTVFDDCDNILFDEVSLNLLKAALDSKKTRNLSWLADSRSLREEEVPNTFEFEGSVIFLTNLDFERTTSSKLKSHLEAIVSRCHYLDLTINSQRDQLLRIKQIVSAGMLNEYGFRNNEEQMIVSYMIDNATFLRELSLRMVKKIADLVAAKPKDWIDLVEATCLRREAKYKRLTDQKQVS